MKKITGKVVSLVLALALVVTSFSSTFAFAAASKTEYLGVSTADGTAVSLVNGRSGLTSETDVTGAIKYSVNGTTFDHLNVAGMTAADIARKDGSDLVSWKIDSTNSKILLQLKDSSAVGTETLAVRYTATNHRYTDPTKDILFSKVVNYVIKVYQKDSYSVNITDTTLDKNGTVADDKMTMDVIGTVVQNVLKDATGTQKDAGSLADTVAKPVSVAANKDGSFILNSEKNNVVNGAADGDFCVKVSSSNKADLKLTDGDKTKGFTATLTAPTGADFLNQGTLVFYATPTTGAKEVALDTAHTISASATIKNSVSLDGTSLNAIKMWHGSSWAVKSTDTFDEKSTGEADPLNKNAKIPATGAINVTGADVVLDADTTMDGNCTVGAVTGDVKFTVNNGYARSVDVKDFEMTKGTVGAVTASTSVTISGGTAGAIDAGSVKLDATDAKVPTKVGTISAGTIEVKSTKAVVTTGAVTMTGTANSVDASAATGDKITLIGDKIVVPSIDFSYYTSTLDLKGFTGTIAAPINAANGTVSTSTDTDNNASNVTVNGALNVSNLQVTTGTLTVATSLNAGMISGAGTLVIPAGKMYVKNSMTGISLKLSNAKFAPGTTVFSADAYKVYDGMFTPVGFTIDYDAVAAVANRTTDVFKIKTVDFAGLAIAPATGTSNEVVLGQSATFNVSAYPAGTKLPDNTKIDISFSGSSDNFSYTTTENSITITGKTYDDLFATLNKGTITATLVDKDSGIAVYTYSPTTYDVVMLKTPKTSYKSDTTGSLSVEAGKTYQFLITSLNGKVPSMTVGTPGVFTVGTPVLKAGTTNQYLIKITATGKVGAAAGIYVNGEARLLVATVKAPSFKCDTLVPVTVAAGKTYQYKITAGAAPSFEFGTKNVFKPAAIKHVGNDYFFTITPAANAKSGAATGVYVNGVKVNVATVK